MLLISMFSAIFLHLISLLAIDYYVTKCKWRLLAPKLRGTTHEEEVRDSDSLDLISYSLAEH